jgi:hypothetical protein
VPSACLMGFGAWHKHRYIPSLLVDRALPWRAVVFAKEAACRLPIRFLIREIRVIIPSSTDSVSGTLPASPRRISRFPALHSAVKLCFLKTAQRLLKVQTTQIVVAN